MRCFQCGKTIRQTFYQSPEGEVYCVKCAGHLGWATAESDATVAPPKRPTLVWIVSGIYLSPTIILLLAWACFFGHLAPEPRTGDQRFRLSPFG